MAMHPSASKKALKAVWTVELENGERMPYTNEETAAMEKRYNGEDKYMKTSIYTFTSSVTGEFYAVDLIQGTQTNVETGKVRRVFRSGPPRTYSGISIGDPNNPQSTPSNTTSQTPMHKIEKRLNECSRHPGAKYAVLLSTGSLNPMHHGHIASLELSAQELAKDDYIVLGGFESPTHDVHVSQKGEWIPGKNRLEMAEAALKDHSIFAVDRWEVEQNAFKDYDVVAQHLVITLKQRFPDIHIDVFYVMGADRYYFAKNCLTNGLGAIVVSRSAEGLAYNVVAQKNQLKSEYPKRYYWIENELLMKHDLSSTTVRQRIKRNEDISDLVPKGVVDYVNNHNITFQKVAKCEKWVLTKKIPSQSSHNMKHMIMGYNSSHGNHGAHSNHHGNHGAHSAPHGNHGSHSAPHGNHGPHKFSHGNHGAHKTSYGHPPSHNASHGNHGAQKTSHGHHPVHNASHGHPGAHKTSYGHPPSHNASHGHPGAHKTTYGHPPSHNASHGHPGAHKTSYGYPPSHNASYGHPPSHNTSHGHLVHNASHGYPGSNNSSYNSIMPKHYEN